MQFVSVTYEYANISNNKTIVQERTNSLSKVRLYKIPMKRSPGSVIIKDRSTHPVPSKKKKRKKKKKKKKTTVK